MPKIFISYRRIDGDYIAKSLYNQLKLHFSEQSIFLDEKIPMGDDYRENLKAEVQQCQVLIAVISPAWRGIKDDNISCRIDDPSDWVRIEIESALARNIPVIPLLVMDARLPKENELPDTLKSLAYRQATTLRPRHDFDTDMNRLIKAIEEYFNSCQDNQSFGENSQEISAEADYLSNPENQDEQPESTTSSEQTDWESVPFVEPPVITVEKRRWLSRLVVRLPIISGVVIFTGVIILTLALSARNLSINESPKRLISSGENTKFKGIASLSDDYPQPDKSYADLKHDGVKAFAAENYKAASEIFSNIRNEAADEREIRNSNRDTPEFEAATKALQDPEVLIFRNNAEVRYRHQQGEPIYTIAAAIPLTDSRNKPFNIGKEMLWGIAQAQDKAVNSTNPGTRKINLEVVIVNDRNQPKQAGALAKALTRFEEDGRQILAVVGHYTSASTCEGLKQAYNEASVVVISPLSTVVPLRKECGGSNLFFPNYIIK